MVKIYLGEDVPNNKNRLTYVYRVDEPNKPKSKWKSTAPISDFLDTTQLISLYITANIVEIPIGILLDNFEKVLN